MESSQRKPQTRQENGRDIAEQEVDEEGLKDILEQRKDMNRLKENNNNVKKGERKVSEKTLEENANKLSKVMGKKFYSSSYCKKSVVQKKNLNGHVKAVHEGENPQSCKHCNKSFPRKNNLNRHISAVHKGEKKYTCFACDFNCTNSFNLKRDHSLVHATSMPSTCKNCKKGFPRKDRW